MEFIKKNKTAVAVGAAVTALATAAGIYFLSKNEDDLLEEELQN